MKRAIIILGCVIIVSVLALLPWFAARARPIATPEHRCAGRLNQIGKAYLTYLADHDQYAKRLVDLQPYLRIQDSFKQYHFNPNAFLCPSNRREVSPEMTAAKIDAWTDYLFNQGITTSSPMDTVVVCCQPKYHRGRVTPVVFLDGSINWCKPDEYNRYTSNLFQRSKEP